MWAALPRHPPFQEALAWAGCQNHTACEQCPEVTSLWLEGSTPVLSYVFFLLLPSFISLPISPLPSLPFISFFLWQPWGLSLGMLENRLELSVTNSAL